MFGLYVKRRGWIKDARLSEFTCCRNPSDINKDFLFVNKHQFNKVKRTYDWMFKRLDDKGVEYIYKKIPEDLRMDKRVIPHKKNSKNWMVNVSPNFEIDDSDRYIEFCSYCQLLVEPSEQVTEEGVCIHCLKAIKDKLDKVYDEMDDEIKRAWERARLIDEI